MEGGHKGEILEKMSGYIKKRGRPPKMTQMKSIMPCSSVEQNYF
jgi:hypothetical protein